MRFCPFCARDNEDQALTCGHCGKRLPLAKRPAEGHGLAEEPAPSLSGAATPGARGLGELAGAAPDRRPAPNPTIRGLGVSARPAGLAPRLPLRARIEALMSAEGSRPVVRPPENGVVPAVD